METPRRRSQNREPKAEETPAAGTASDIRSAENCVNTVRDLQDELKNAKKTLINADNCVVSRVSMMEKLEFLEKTLPDTVKKAAIIVRDEQIIRDDVE